MFLGNESESSPFLWVFGERVGNRNAVSYHVIPETSAFLSWEFQSLREKDVGSVQKQPFRRRRCWPFTPRDWSLCGCSAHAPWGSYSLTSVLGKSAPACGSSRSGGCRLWAFWSRGAVVRLRGQLWLEDLVKALHVSETKFPQINRTPLLMARFTIILLSGRVETGAWTNDDDLLYLKEELHCVRFHQEKLIGFLCVKPWGVIVLTW